jgi:hypothetical protein
MVVGRPNSRGSATRFTPNPHARLAPKPMTASAFKAMGESANATAVSMTASPVTPPRASRVAPWPKRAR